MHPVSTSFAVQHWQLLTLAGIVCFLASIAAINLLRRFRAVRARLKDQRAHLDAALGNMRQGLLMFDAAGRLVLFNPRFVEMYDLPSIFPRSSSATAILRASFMRRCSRPVCPRTGSNSKSRKAS